MRRLLVCALALACHPGGLDEPDPTVLELPLALEEEPEPQAPEAAEPSEMFPADDRRRITFRVEDPELRALVEDAADRWYGLTGLLIDVSPDEGQHVVRWREPEDMPRRPGIVLLGHTGGTWAAARISLSRGCAPELRVGVLVHELWHVLARENGHASGLVSSFEPAEGKDWLLHDDAVEAVCRARDCAWLTTEDEHE